MQLTRLLLKKIKGLCNILALHDLSITEFFGRTGVTETFLSEAENIDITDAYKVRRRQGSARVTVTTPHSLWSNGNVCLYRSGDSLYQLNQDYSSVALWSGLTTQSLRMYYVEIAGLIYCSDGHSHLVIKNGICRAWRSQLDLRQDSGSRNRMIADILLDPLPIGSPIEYYNSMLYSAEGEVIWHSEPYVYELCDLANNYIMEESDVRMLKAVKDGIWVSNNEKTFFYLGDAPPFKRIEKVPYPAIKGTDIKVPGHYLERGKTEGYKGVGKSESLILWASPKGFCMGGDGGEFINFTDEVYSLPEATEGASLFRQSRGLNQFIAGFKNAQDAENVYE